MSELANQSDILGTLIIVVLKARDLNDKHSFYKQDVFAQVTLNSTSKRTRTDIKGGQRPEWDEEIRFPIMKDGRDKHRKLEVSCFAKEHKSDDLLGTGSIDISETLRTGEFDDWVGLETNGVSRGDVYLEMTYYASAPAPATNTGLAVPTNSGLTRRPSKLSPSDRLSRPVQTLNNVPPTQGYQSQRLYHRDSESNDFATTTHLHPSSPPSSRSSSAGSAKAQNAALPPLPEGITSSIPPPNALLPGGGLRGKAPLAASPNLQPVPSILRPRNPKSSPTPIPQFVSERPPFSPPPQHSHGAPPTHMSVSTSSAYGRYQAPAAQAYSGYPPTDDASHVPYPHHAVSATTLQISEERVPSTFSFPVPSVPALVEPVDYSTNYRKPQGVSSTQQQTDSSFPDPYLQARYQSPLPLPPGSSSLPRGREQYAIRSSPAPDADRLRAIRLAEEEAARRKAQEEKDLELALQLDRELNVADQQPSSTQTSQTATGGGMPGGWGVR